MVHGNILIRSMIAHGILFLSMIVHGTFTTFMSMIAHGVILLPVHGIHSTTIRSKIAPMHGIQPSEIASLLQMELYGNYYHYYFYCIRLEDVLVF